MSRKNGNPRKHRRRRRRRYGRVFPRPDGPGWLVQFVDLSGRKAPSGRRAYLTKAVSTEREGEELLKEIERAILLGRFAPTQEDATCDLTLLQAIDEFLEAKRAEGRSANGVRRYETSRQAMAPAIWSATWRGAGSGSGAVSGSRDQRARTRTSPSL
ncbi:MAG: hypothetical protein ACYS0K_14065 [Planctomycetota bacterium]|jgi:hypothetical protein